MPTEIPARGEPRLSWSDAARFFWLMWRARRLSRLMVEADRRTAREGVEGGAGAELLRVARAWIACHGALAELLAVPEPPAVAKVRAAIEMPRAVSAE